MMQLGALVPFTDTGGDPSLVRDFAQSLEAMGYDFLEAPDHVLGVPEANTYQNLFRYDTRKLIETAKAAGVQPK